MPFNRLLHQRKNEDGETKECYDINNPRPFNTKNPLNDCFESVFNFAYGMTFGKVGEHRDHRTGGIIRRKNGELFCNTFQGKMAEYGVYKTFISDGIKLPEPDLGMWELGVWDDTDLVFDGKKINVKSAANFSNLLLLETKDWNSEAYYIPNINNGGGLYDYFILVRIKPDIKSIFRNARLFYSDKTDKSTLYQKLESETWQYDIPGFITRKELAELITGKYILPQGSYLNGRTKMDAENYYCQAGDMNQINDLLNILNKQQ